MTEDPCDCGAQVVDKDKHEAFHARIAALEKHVHKQYKYLMTTGVPAEMPNYRNMPPL